MAKILFVCTGNICRSPTAEGVLRHRVTALGQEKNWEIASAGTHRYHIGEAPDPRSIKAALRRGVDISNQRARYLDKMDYYQFDVILALDKGHLAEIEKRKPADATAKIAMFLAYAGMADGDVPDPYYGNAVGFEHVLDLVEQAVDGLLTKLG